MVNGERTGKSSHSEGTPIGSDLARSTIIWSIPNLSRSSGHRFWLQDSKSDVVAGWCDSGSIFVADAVCR